MRNVRNKLLIIVLFCTLSFHVSNSVYASESKIIINGNQEKSNLLLWNEEFNEEKINDNYWKVLGFEDFMNEYGYGSTLPFWMYDPVLCKVKDGCLSMKTQMFWNNRQNCVRKGNQSVTSSKIISKNLIECKYGRIDIRAKLAKGQGIWSMCYLLGNDTYGMWPNCGELDFFDYFINDNPQLYQMAISKEFNSISGKQKSWIANVENANAEFHLYSIEWSEKNIKFYVDNKLTGCYEQSMSSNKDTGKEYEAWPFDSPFYFVMQCRPKEMYDGDKGKEGWTKIAEDGDIDTYEDGMYIDYIRIYSLNKEEQTTNESSTMQVSEKKPAKIKIKSAKRTKQNKIFVKFKKVKNAKKYQIQYATNKKFKKARIKITKKNSYVIKKISKKKTYYIRVRGVNGTKKGAWSKIKKIKSVKK